MDDCDMDDDFDFSGAFDADEDLADLKRLGYGRCAGCQGQEPLEVLAAMDGYCSSSCRKDHEE